MEGGRDEGYDGRKRLRNGEMEEGAEMVESLSAARFSGFSIAMHTVGKFARARIPPFWKSPSENSNVGWEKKRRDYSLTG